MTFACCKAIGKQTRQDKQSLTEEEENRGQCTELLLCLFWHCKGRAPGALLESSTKYVAAALEE